MRFRDIAVLIAIETNQGPNGYPVETESRSEVYVDLHSVKRSEFYASLQTGQTLLAAFVVRACDYSGQSRMEHDGKQYQVIRAYTQDGELMELNCAEYKGE